MSSPQSTSCQLQLQRSPVQVQPLTIHIPLGSTQIPYPILKSPCLFTSLCPPTSRELLEDGTPSDLSPLHPLHQAQSRHSQIFVDDGYVQHLACDWNTAGIPQMTLSVTKRSCGVIAQCTRHQGWWLWVHLALPVVHKSLNISVLPFCDLRQGITLRGPPCRMIRIIRA